MLKRPIAPPMQQPVPLGGGVQPPQPGKIQSPLGQAIAQRGNAGRYAGGMGLAPARPPRVPIQNTLRNIDQQINQAGPQLKAMGGRLQQQPMPMDPLHPAAAAAVQQAMKHLQGKDASSASAVLRSSPEAMAHPHVARAAHALQTAHGIAPATKTLSMLASQSQQPG